MDGMGWDGMGWMDGWMDGWDGWMDGMGWDGWDGININTNNVIYIHINNIIMI